MSEPRRDVPGIVGSLLFIAGGALALWYSRDFSALGSVFPRTIAVAMIACACAYIAVALLRPGAAPQPQPGSVGRRIALVAVMVAWSALLERIGFLTTSIAGFVAILVIANYDRWTPRRALAYGASGAVVLGVLYAIFRFGLQVPLPAGAFL